MPATRDTKQGKPTYKEDRYAHAYVDTKGNQTKAALLTYDTTDYNTAAQIGSKNIRKKRVKDRIAEILQKIDVDKIDEKFIATGIADLAVNGKTEGTKVKSFELLAKWKAMLTEKTEQSINTELRQHVDVAKASTDELLDELTKRLKVSSTGTSTLQDSNNSSDNIDGGMVDIPIVGKVNAE